MLAALASFKGEWLCDNAYRQDTHILGDLGYYRCCTRSCSAAHSGCYEYHLSALYVAGDLLHTLFGGFLSDLRITACAKSFCKLFSYLEFVLSLASGQRLTVSVDCQEVYILRVRVNHTVHSIAAASADPDNNDFRIVFFSFFKLQHCLLFLH